MLAGLVEYESSDNEGDADGKSEEASSDHGGGGGVAPSADVEAADPLDAVEGCESPTANSDSGESDGDRDDLAAMAAANDAVEESLVMRVPASVQSEARAADLPPQAKPPQPTEASRKRQLLLDKKRRVLLLDPSANGADSEEDENDDDAVKRQRIAAAEASGHLRGATSLLARLPKPKALAVREGGARILAATASSSTFAAFPRAATKAKPPAPLSATEQPVLRHESLEDQDNLLGSVLPQRELHRYRQATGASLTAQVDSSVGGGSGSGLVEVRQADQLAGVDIQMTKELTRNAGADPRRKPAGPEPNSMARRKHQITYLAFQAQERELELKNSWSDARFNQRSSQNKYGF